MESKKSTVLTLILLIGITFFAFAQENNQEEMTVEELFLKNVELGIIREQADSFDRDMKLLALTQIEQLVKEGKVTKSSAEIQYILDLLSREGTGHVVTENRKQVNYFPEVRRRACNLLGQIGGVNSKDTLIQVLREDNEPMVLAEAVFALGQIGLNENNEVVETIAYTLENQDITNPDNNFAFASLLALEKIAKKEGGLTDPSALQAIVQIAQGNYVRDVRLKALEVIEELRQYNQ